jgi:large subunit ribosomal protein L18e
MKTKTKIEKQTKRKTNLNLVETIRIAKKNKEWEDIAGILSSSRKKWKSINLDLIEKESKEGDIIIVPGKVLSQGEISKKIRVVAFAFSELAKEKLLKSKCEIVYLNEEIKKNPKAKGVKILI